MLQIRITNPKNGLSKIINGAKLNVWDFIKTLQVYSNAGFEYKIIRG